MSDSHFAVVADLALERRVQRVLESYIMYLAMYTVLYDFVPGCLYGTYILVSRATGCRLKNSLPRLPQPTSPTQLAVLAAHLVVEGQRYQVSDLGACAALVRSDSPISRVGCWSLADVVAPVVFARPVLDHLPDCWHQHGRRAASRSEQACPDRERGLLCSILSVLSWWQRVVARAD